MITKIIKQDIAQILDDNSIDWNKFQDCTILITGPTGMIGQYLTFTLLSLQKNYNLKIILLARNSEKVESLFSSYLNDDTRVIISNLNRIPKIDSPVDYILHTASLAAPDYYETIPVNVIEPNVIGTYELLKIAVEKKCKNFLFFSSSEIYGKITKTKNYSELELGLLDCMDVRNCYAESKRMGENLCASFYHQYKIPTNSVRIFHTYGPTMDINNDRRAFSEFVKNIVNEEDIIIKGTGLTKRPFCYITDAIIAFFIILLNGEPGETYNLSNEDNYISINELAETLVNLNSKKDTKVLYGNRRIDDNYSIKKDENYVTASSSKLKLLGWNPKIDFVEGFTRTIASKCEEKENG